MTIESAGSQLQKFDAELDDWTPIIETAAFDPSRLEIRLAGQIFGDDAHRFPDGRRVLTSPLRTPKWRIVVGAVVRSQNTRYRLLTRSKLPEIKVID